MSLPLIEKLNQIIDESENKIKELDARQWKITLSIIDNSNGKINRDLASQLDNIDREKARLEKLIMTCRANLQVVQILEGEGTEM
jgi:hypothetical protein